IRSHVWPGFHSGCTAFQCQTPVATSRMPRTLLVLARAKALSCGPMQPLLHPSVMQPAKPRNQLRHAPAITGVGLREGFEHEPFLDMDPDLDEDDTDGHQHKPSPESDQKDATDQHPKEAREASTARSRI